MVDLPHPDGPTMATFFPAGTVKERLVKMGRVGWYAKETLSKRMEPPWRWRGGAFGTSLGGGFSSTSLKRTSMSRRFCLISRYIDPKKLSGRESWKISWLTMTTSPTVIVPIHKKARSELGEGRREGGGNRKHTINDALCSQKHRHGQCA